MKGTAPLRDLWHTVQLPRQEELLRKESTREKQRSSAYRQGTECAG